MDLKSFEKRKYLKHRKNIKINNNILRAFEINKIPKFRRKKWKKKDKTKKIVIKKLLKFIFIIILLLILLLPYNTNLQRNLIPTNFKRNKVVVGIFAGRKKHLEILMVYLKYLLYHNKISEIHLWQFTNNKNDTDYLKSISNLHKTNGNFTDYADIYPEINNNSFEIKIKMKKNGSCILLNDKYEIIFNIDNTNYIKVTLNINNNYYSWVHNIKYKETEFVKYIFKIIDNKLIINGANNFEIKHDIDKNNFDSIKIKSLNNSQTFWDYKEVKNKNIKLFDTIHRRGGAWYEMYGYYIEYNDYDILMKMDDDICYLDIERFDEYINYIKISKNNITFPNLVNHAVSVFYNNKNGLVPNSELKYRYQNRKSAWDIFDYYADGQQGKKIHEYFLNNIDKFTHNNFTPILLNGLKPSICAFGITREVYQKSYLSTAIFPNESMAKTYIFGDEPYASKLLNNYLYPRFICIHFAFGYQRTSGISDSLLAIYKNLAKKYIIPDDS